MYKYLMIMINQFARTTYSMSSLMYVAAEKIADVTPDANGYSNLLRFLLDSSSLVGKESGQQWDVLVVSCPDWCCDPERALLAVSLEGERCFMVACLE